MRLRRFGFFGGLLWAITLMTSACGLASQSDPAAQPVTVSAPTPTTQAATPTAVVMPQVTPENSPEATVDLATVDFAPLVEVIEQEMATQQVPGLAVAVIHKGTPLFRQGFGLADVASQGAVTPETLFRIGSITKPLTAIAILQLVEAGMVELDAPVVTYLPDFTVSDQITVRQLLSHSSGLGDAAIPYGRTDATALADYVKSLTPESAFAPPGALFSYSNPGFNILGRMIEVVSGQSYADYMTTQLLPALGMSHTTFDREKALSEGLALGYYPGRGGPEVVERDPDNWAEYPSGFAFSNVEDLSQLALFLLNDGMLDGTQLLPPDLVQAMKTPVVRVEPLDLGYGLGLILRPRNGHPTAGHNGSINGYTATMEVMPDQELAVIVLSNRNNYDPERIVQAAFDRFVMPTETVPVQEIALDDAAMASYAGHYRLTSALPNEPAEEVIVDLQNGRLTASLPQVTFEMRAVGNDLFDLYAPQTPQPVARIAFMRDESGAIQSMNFTMHALMKMENSQ